jgi:hypothetical protein
MALYDPDLQKAFDANRAAIAKAVIPETAIRNFENMSISERRWAHMQAEMQALRHDKLAQTDEALGRDPGYNRQCAANRRATADALKAVGL